MENQIKPTDFLWGRKTLDIFADDWPEPADFWPGINDVTKYVISKAMKESHWQNTVFAESLEDLTKLKNSEGSDIQIHGSGELIQVLLKHDLVDELWLIIPP